LLNLSCLRYVSVQVSTVHRGFLQYAYLILQLQQLSDNSVGNNTSLNTVPMPKTLILNIASNKHRVKPRYTAGI